MRNNLPITNVEYILTESDMVVSKTDLQGNITYVNHDFITISGFSEAELLGAPQSIVRHPDMPAEAFADFWQALKSGKAWTGMVKNRCKNGDHYWVEANAAPMVENGKVVGYTSIRVKPSRAQVAQAEQAYRTIKDGSKELSIRNGMVVRRSAAWRANPLKALSLRTRITLFSTLLMLTSMANLGLAALDGGVDRSGWALLSATLGVCFAALFGALLRRAAVAPLERICQDIERMSAGDLTGKIEAQGNDELTRVVQALRILQTNIKLLVGQIQDATELVQTGSAEISSGNADLSSRTESQASSLQETAASMEELTSTVKQNAASAHDANALMVSTTAIAVKGGQAMAQVVDTMSDIRHSSCKIAEIVDVIEGIAFQSHILALNAAMEAARAGEQGRGFAVVAIEVRNLAHNSAAAAKKIKTLIDKSVAQVGAGGNLVDNAGKTIGEIVASIHVLEEHLAHISGASAEQSAGIEQVNQAISAMDGITQENAALVEQAAAAAECMQEQSVKLGNLVRAFKLVSGTGAAARPQTTRVAPRRSAARPPAQAKLRLPTSSRTA